jgi:hypothetical protein
MSSVCLFAVACSPTSSTPPANGNAAGSSPAGDNGTGGTGNTTAGGNENGGSATGGGSAAGGDTAGGGTSGGTGTGGGAGNGGTSSPNSDASTGSGDGGPDATAVCAPDTNFQTDKNNCGHCGKSCAGGDCSGGLCVPVLVIDQSYPISGFLDPLSPDSAKGFVDQSKVYLWRVDSSGDAPVHKLLSASSTPATPVSTGEPALQSSTTNVGSVTFNGGNIYEAIEPDTKGGLGQVVVKKLSGNGAPTKVFTLPPGPPDPNNSGGPSDLLWRDIAVASNAIYVAGTTDINGPPFVTEPDRTKIYRIATPVADATSQPTVVVSGLGEVVSELAVFGNATAGDHLFWLDYLGNRPDSDAGPGSSTFVYSAPAMGGDPVLLDDAGTSTSSFASDGTYVYWMEQNDLGKLMHCPLANVDAAHAQPVADAANAMKGIVIQGQYAFFMEFTDPGPIFRVNIGTGDKELLGNRSLPPSIKNSYLFGADANFLYLTSIDAKVYRLPNVP